MSKEYVVMIRRFIKNEREQDFIEWSRSRPIPNVPGFLGKRLARLETANALPPGLTSFHIAGDLDCATYVTIEHWRSIDDFRAYAPHAGTSDQDDFEAAPRQRVILSVV